MNNQNNEALTLPDLKESSELMKKAETLIDFRGYQIEEISKTPSTIDIQVSHSDTNETTIMHIVTQTDHQNNGLGVDTVKDLQQLLTKPNISKVIIFGHRFTESAQNELHDQGVEFFSPTQNILSILNQRELYSTIFKYVDKLCYNKCGSVPQSSVECSGYKKQGTPCPRCNGQGKLERTSSQKYMPYCPTCGGSGEKESKYRCPIRLISDNADFHFRKNWRRLLHDDLISLLDLAS